jgi:hypothetical protein
VDYSTIGEILLKAIEEVNEQFFRAFGLPYRFTDDLQQLSKEDVFDVYMANKAGKPKDDYPTFETKMQVKTAKVRDNRFSVMFSEEAIVPAETVQPPAAQAEKPTEPVVADVVANSVLEVSHEEN